MAEVAMTEKTQEKTVNERPVVLKVDHVAKMFRLPTEQATGLKMAFLNWTKVSKAIPSNMCCAISISRCSRATFSALLGVTDPESPHC